MTSHPASHGPPAESKPMLAGNARVFLAPEERYSVCLSQTLTSASGDNILLKLGSQCERVFRRSPTPWETPEVGCVRQAFGICGSQQRSARKTGYSKMESVKYVQRLARATGG